MKTNRFFSLKQRLIDKTRVTCIKWVPKSTNVFLVSHASGQMYVYKEDLPCGNTPPHYQLFKGGEGFSVHTCRAKSTRNPLYRWIIGENGNSLNEFSFSPCGKFLATVSQDGFLRVFEYDTMQLVGRMRSYFGGLLCLSWSPDGRFIGTGGEDDLITVWSMSQKRVVARGQGHRSWVSVIAFDSYTTSVSSASSSDSSHSHLQHHDRHNNSYDRKTIARSTSSDDEEALAISPERVIPTSHPSLNHSNHHVIPSSSSNNSHSVHNHILTNNLTPSNTTDSAPVTSYRLGSVAQDTFLCLWDLSDDVLRQPVGRSRASILVHSPSTQANVVSNNREHGSSFSGNQSTVTSNNTTATLTTTATVIVSASSSNNRSSSISSKGKNNVSTTGDENLPDIMGNNTTSSSTSNLIPLPKHSSSDVVDGIGPLTNSSSSASSKKKEHKRSFSLGSRASSDKHHAKKDKDKDSKDKEKFVDDPVKL